MDTVSIPKDRLEEFSTRLKKLQKRAAKLGVAQPTFTVESETITSRMVVVGYDEHGRPVHREKIIATLNLSLFSPEVKLADWQLLATIDPIQGGQEYVVKTIPGATVAHCFRPTDPYFCDHCKKRRKRKATFLVRHEDGQVKQVGRNCIRDFLGHVTPEHIAAVVNFVRELSDVADSENEWWGQGFTYDPCSDLKDVLEVTATVIRHFGWVAKSSAGFDQTPTAYVVDEYLTGNTKRATELRKGTPVEDVDRKRAEETIAWVCGLDEDAIANNEYLTTLHTLMAYPTIESKFFSYVCSSISAYMKHLDRQGEILRKKDTHKNSQYVGTLGKRLVLKDLTVETVRFIDGQWGVTTLIKFVDPEGNLFVWFASGDKGEEFDIGTTHNIRGTIHMHDTYNNVKQTHLKRCKREIAKGAYTEAQLEELKKAVTK